MPAPSNPAPRPQASILAKLGDRLKRATTAYKNAPTVLSSGGELPGGISGVAQLSACKIAVKTEGDDAGKFYFYAAGIVQEPELFTDARGNQHRVKGKRTSIQTALYDTPAARGKRKTFEDHYAWMFNEWRKLGVNTANFPDQMTDGYLESVCAALVKAKPYFAFETREMPQDEQDKKAGRSPMVIHFWNGLVPDYETPPNMEAAMAGVVGGAASANGTAFAEPSLTVSPDQGEESGSADEINPDDLDRSDIGSLLERANGSDADDAIAAQTQLIEMAVAAGHDEAEVKKRDTWEEVVAMISSPPGDETSAEEGEGEGGGEESAEGEGEEEVAPPPPPPPPPAPKTPEPVKGKTAKYRPLDPKDKTKRVKKAIECEIVSVDKATKTVTLKSLVDGKTLYKGVKWDILNK